VEATVTLADQWQPVELYQVARGLRWKVRQALGGWMHHVARQDAQEAGGREASKLPEISDIGLRRCPHLNRRAATNAAPQSGTGGDQPTGRTQIVTFGRSTDRHGDDREAAQNGLCAYRQRGTATLRDYLATFIRTLPGSRRGRQVPTRIMSFLTL
jgi:hypothetical protein